MFQKEIKILIVDDMSTMRRIVKNGLNDLGYDTIENAKNGQLGWEIIETSHSEGSPIELVMCDWNMPVCTGLELLQKVRADEKTKDLPFIMLTAKSEEKDMQEAQDAGVSAYLTKPFSGGELENTLREVFEKKAAA
ncbi:MAG: response regulator [Oligoflexales bacterium]